MDAERISRRIAAIRDDRERGAAQLAVEAVRLLGDMAADRTVSDEEFGQIFPHAARQLARAQPSMAPLLNGAGAMLAEWRGAGGESRGPRSREAVASAATGWIARQGAAGEKIASLAAETVGGTLITLSHSSTVLAALKECWNRDGLSGVIVAESRPLYEGRRTAAELASLGIPVALITEAQIGVFVAMANAAVVGADTLMTGGAIVNKAGTLLLALAARRARVPFYALADTQKIAPAPGRRRRMPFTIEENDPSEVLPDPIEGVAVRNAYFDLTPGRYITGYVTEEGVLRARDITRLARTAPGAALLP